MKLTEALEKYAELESERAELTIRSDELSATLLDVGRKIFQLVRMTAGGSGELNQFQVGDSQYSVTSSGTIKLINCLVKVDGCLAIE